MRKEDINREKVTSPQLTPNEIFYLLSGRPPEDTEMNSTQIRNNVRDDKIEKIPSRFFNLIEDFATLRYNDSFEEDDLLEISTKISNPESENLIYSDENEISSVESTDAEAYKIGLQLGHLADLFSYPIQDQESTDRTRYVEALIRGFALGVNGYGKNRLQNFTEDFDDRVEKRFVKRASWSGYWPGGPSGGSVINDENLTETKKMTELVEELVDEVVVDTGDDPFLKKMHAELENGEFSISGFPAVQNEIFNIADDHRSEFEDETALAEYAVECLKENHSWRLKPLYQFEEVIMEDLEYLFDEDDNNMGGNLQYYEVLQGSVSFSESKNEDIYECIRKHRSGTQEDLSDDRIGSSLNKLKGEHTLDSVWDYHPLIDQDNTPTDYGTLISKIIFPTDKIRETDRYLPTPTDDADHIRPTFADVLNACYGFALDCPSVDQIDGSWKSLYYRALRDRFGMGG